DILQTTSGQQVDMIQTSHIM
ncbi:hypothetical protein BIW11_04630, partial [Tropilaelaps mercedesae]